MTPDGPGVYIADAEYLMTRDPKVGRRGAYVYVGNLVEGPFVVKLDTSAGYGGSIAGYAFDQLRLL